MSSNFGLGAFGPEPYKTSILPEDVAREAKEVIPGFHTEGNVAPKYREHLLMEYIEHDGRPPRPGYNRDHTRLLRSFIEVEERMDREFIRETVFNVYDGPGGYENRPTRLRNEFDEILENAGYD